MKVVRLTREQLLELYPPKRRRQIRLETPAERLNWDRRDSSPLEDLTRKSNPQREPGEDG